MMLSLLRPAPDASERAEDEALGASEAQALGERVRELETILDTATDGVVLIEGDGRIAGLNHTAEALFGVESDDVTGAPFTDLLAEESRRAALDYIDGLAMNGVASVLNDGREVIGKASRGGLIPLFMTIGPLGDSGKYCAVLRDITHWKNVEEELVAARRAAEAANAQKSDFLAKISHEIRTPMSGVMGMVCSSVSVISGRFTIKRVPGMPCPLSATTVPPCISTNCRTRVNPTPKPP